MRIHPRLGLSLLTACLVLSMGQAIARAQQEPTNSPPTKPATLNEPPIPLVTLKSVEEALKRITEDATLDEEVRKTLIGHYQEAQAQLQVAEQYKSELTKLEEERRAAPTVLEDIRLELGQPAPERRSGHVHDVPLAELETSFSQHEADLAAARKLVELLEDEKRKLAERKLQTPNEIAAAKHDLEKVAQESMTPEAPDERREISLARGESLEARKIALQQKLARHEAEMSTSEIRAELLKARQDQAARRVAELEAEVKYWQDEVNHRRKIEADKATQEAKEAQEKASRQHPLVEKLAEDNVAFAERRTGPEGLARKNEHVAQSLEDVTRRVAEIAADFVSVKKRVELAGLTNAIALYIRERLDRLPDLRQYRRNIRARQTETATVQVDQLDVEEQLHALRTSFERQVKEIMQRVASDVPENRKPDVEVSVRELLQARLKLLEDVNSDLVTLRDKMEELDREESKLIREAESYAAFIRERILWIRSNNPLGIGDLRQAWSGGRWLFDPGSWRDLGRLLWDDAHDNPSMVLLAGTGFLLLLAAQRPLRRKIAQIGEEASKSSSLSFRPTLTALFMTVLLAMTWPALLAFVAWRLESAYESQVFAKVVAAGLRSLAVSYLILSFLNHLCRPLGLGGAHFGWSDRSRALLRTNIFWFMGLTLPCTFVLYSTQAFLGDGLTKEDLESLGRLAFILWLLAMAFMAHRILRPRDGILAETLIHNPGNWLVSFTYFWYPAMAGGPLLLTIAAGLGYYYTAVHLALRLRMSLWLIIGLVLIQHLFHRWLLATRRRLAIEQFRRRQAALSESKETTEAARSEILAVVDQADLPTISAQTQKLLRAAVAVALVVGLWLTWIDVLPALGRFRDFHLWTITVKASQEGTAGTESVELLKSITLADLLVASVICVMTVVAGKNIPGLLEIALLQRLPLEAGVRYAITTVCRYLITLIGVVLAFGKIGIGWSNVQWLAAAITVGLGFGLQEIFANFVSGLILLFERPMRVGDVVTIGNTTGKVSRIRIRATTITDWDRRELIVPNKDFITGQLMNWTLSDRVLRAVVRVGVAYGSDTDLVTKILLSIAKADPRVMTDPEPKAFLTAFGSSTLDFELNAFVRDLEDAPEVRHDLHQAIETALREAGIEIAFPQQDINIRALPPELTRPSPTPSAMNRGSVWEGEAPAEPHRR